MLDVIIEPPPKKEPIVISGNTWRGQISLDPDDRQWKQEVLYICRECEKDITYLMDMAIKATYCTQTFCPNCGSKDKARLDGRFYQRTEKIYYTHLGEKIYHENSV